MEQVPPLPQPEQPPQPDLLAAFGEREINVFGISGTFNDLAKMCPIPADDPRMTLEAKNLFVVKAANEGGLEIEPEHVGLFTRILSDQGIEPKFTVAPPKEETRVVEEKPVAVKPEPKPTPVTPKIKEVAPPPVVPETINRQEIPRAPVEQTIPTPEVAVARPVAELHEQVIREAAIAEAISQASSESPAEVLQEASADEPAEVVVTIAHTEIIEALRTEVDQESAEEASTLEATTADTVQTPTETPAEIAAAAWTEELAKPAAEIYDDFTRLLYEFAPAQSGFAAAEEDGWVAVQAETTCAAPLFIEVADRLATLETTQRETATQIIQAIVGTIQAIRLAEVAGDTENNPNAATKLEELCSELFAAIGLFYDQEEIKYFVNILLQSEFQPGAAPAELFAENIGTHEVKRTFRLLRYGLPSDSEDENIVGPQRLGTFVAVRAIARH